MKKGKDDMDVCNKEWQLLMVSDAYCYFGGLEGEIVTIERVQWSKLSWCHAIETNEWKIDISYIPPIRSFNTSDYNELKPLEITKISLQLKMMFVDSGSEGVIILCTFYRPLRRWIVNREKSRIVTQEELYFARIQFNEGNGK